jgi:hypothetical protein
MKSTGTVWSCLGLIFSQTGLIFNIETSKSPFGLISVSVVFLGLIWVSHRSRLGLTLVIKTVLFGLVCLGSHLGLA